MSKNIINKNGRCAVMLGPHSAKNGIVTIKDVTAISSTFAVKIGKSHVKKGAPDQTPGYFHDASSITNIHAVYGESALVKRDALLEYPNIESYYDYLKELSDNKFFEGPSIGAVEYTPTTFKVKLKNVTMEGFPHNNDKPIFNEVDKRKANWGEEKSKWEKAHPGEKYKSDKGVAVNDYEVEAYSF